MSISNDEQRPTDRLTAADAAKIMSQFDNFQKVLDALNAQVETIANEQKSIRSHVSFFSQDFAISREHRNKIEVTTLEREREILKQRLGIIDETLDAKKAEVISDTGKVRAIAMASIEEQERLEAEARSKWWRETFQQAGRQVIIVTTVGTVAGILTALGWFLLFYLRNR